MHTPNMLTIIIEKLRNLQYLIWSINTHGMYILSQGLYSNFGNKQYYYNIIISGV